MSGLPMGYGIIGCGAHSEKRYLPVFQRKDPVMRLVAVQRRNREKLLEVQRRWQIPRVYTSPEELVRDADVNVVLVASPPGLHKEHVCLAARAGKDVIVEKPMAASLTDAGAMVNCCRENAVTLFVAFSLRYCAAVRQLSDLLSAGTIGKLYHMEGCFTINASGSQRTWLEDPHLSGGGAVADLGSHILDLMRFFHPLPVKYIEAILQPPFTPDKIERQATVSLQFEDGVTAHLFTSFQLPRYKSLTLYGNQGRIFIENFSEIDEEVIIFVNREGRNQIIAVKNNNHFHAMLVDVTRKWGGESKKQSNTSEGLYNQELIERIYRDGLK